MENQTIAQVVEEEVLCIDANLSIELLPPMHKNSIYQYDYVTKFFNAIIPNHVFFVKRSIAEKSLEYKQIIPYIVFHHYDTTLTYQRTSLSGESRIHGKYSVGVGGHINRTDANDLLFSDKNYYKAIYREIHEEIGTPDLPAPALEAGGLLASNAQARQADNGIHIHDITKPKFIINMEDGGVNSMHIGFVHFIKLRGNKVYPKEDTMDNLKFIPNVTLKKNTDNFETWSKLVIEKMDIWN